MQNFKTLAQGWENLGGVVVVLVLVVVVTTGWAEILV
jgi:hypothetical protein